MDEIEERVHKAAVRLPKPPSELTGVTYSYGTAGFRLKANLLRSTLQRTGMLAALRSASCQMAVGIVVTASHNPVEDNGVKVVDPDGGMLSREWEAYADTLANVEGATALFKVLAEIADKEKVSLKELPAAKLFIARDTRPSGEWLLQDAIEGFESVAGPGRDAVTNLGILTTPQVHWIVRAHNRGEPASETDYFSRLSEGFRALTKLSLSVASSVSTPVLVDAANGVGAEKLLAFQGLLEGTGLLLDVHNAGGAGHSQLNDKCGADYVQKEKQLPRGFDKLDCVDRRCVSFDGDADRLVYFSMVPIPKVAAGGLKNPTQFRLFDGDKIAALVAAFVMEQLKDISGSPAENHIGGGFSFGHVRVGVVQTAYANGASTSFLRDMLGLEVVITSTGVKYLHEEAKEFDVGIYFEANGHGTVLFGKKFLTWLQTENSSSSSDSRTNAIERLLAVSEVMNQGVGDAISGLLLVEAILRHQGWSLKEWDSLYTDLPSRMLKVKVADRQKVKTANAETKVVEPKGLQEAIDAQIATYKNGRAFVRPSGTEDIVRVYAEACMPTAANVLAHDIALLVYEHAGGVGPEP